LGDGYNPGLIICQAAAPFIADLSKRLIWPVDLSTYENAAMVVQETTHQRSPLSIDRGMIGRRVPMLRTATGRAYLARCPDRERDVIINHVRRIGDPEDSPFLEEPYLSLMIEQTANRGYGIRNSGEFNAQTSSIAVPIARDDIVLGCISIIWIRTALSLEEAIEQFVAPMLKTAADIPVSP
jgi:IclR family mhp operon transcriptional activator